MEHALLPMAAALPRLQCLRLLDCRELTGLGILQLTQLRQLNRLHVEDFDDRGWEKDMHMEEDGINLSSKVSVAWLHGGVLRLEEMLSITEEQQCCVPACWYAASVPCLLLYTITTTNQFVAGCFAP